PMCHECVPGIVEVPFGKRDIDVLFVIDNSRSMTGTQEQVVQAFPTFLAQLGSKGGLPGLHVGVVSSDVGISPYQTTDCIGFGDDGALQNTPRGDCLGPYDPFISDVPSPS